MNVRIIPKKLHGKVAAITSKSSAHRTVICGALCDAPSFAGINLFSEDIDATLECVKGLGCGVEKTDGGVRLLPHSAPASRRFPCSESGSTLRFMLPVAAALGGGSFIGHGRLPERPTGALMDCLAAHGAVFSNDRLPFEVSGKLTSGEFSLPGDVSSQFVSGLLFALPLLDGDSEIVLTSPLASKGYVDLTVEVISRFGIRVTPTEKGFFVPGNQKYVSPDSVLCEGDWSNAAFWLTAGFLGDEIGMTGLDPESAQKDKRVIEILKEMKREGDITVPCSDIPDLVPVLSVAASGRIGKTVFTETARLRIKESDRAAAVCAMLENLGGKAETDEDSITVFGTGRLNGGRVDSFGDHRIAMSAAVAAVICSSPVIITGAQAVNKSYPRFFEDYKMLGGECYEIDLW